MNRPSAAAVSSAPTSSTASCAAGYGSNFVKTMRALSSRAADPADALEKVTVVDDRLGRLTFTDQMAEGFLHLLGYRDGDVEPSVSAAYGAYNITCSGAGESWAQIAVRVFDLANGIGGPWRPFSLPTTAPPPRTPSPRVRGAPISASPRLPPPASSRATGLSSSRSTLSRCGWLAVSCFAAMC